MKTFRTPAGTELPLLSLKNKDYLAVAFRLVWFREIHPDWAIHTELIQISDTHCIAKAWVIDSNAKIIATAHKKEEKAHFPDFMEKAETGAIGRALATCGFGTQFAPELEEHERIVDTPVNRPVQTQMATETPATAPHQYIKNLSQALAQSTTRGTEEDRPAGPSEAQLRRLFAISRTNGWTDADCKEYLEKLGLTSSRQLNYLQYDAMCKWMQASPKPLLREPGDEG